MNFEKSYPDPDNVGLFRCVRGKRGHTSIFLGTVNLALGISQLGNRNARMLLLSFWACSAEGG